MSSMSEKTYNSFTNKKSSKFNFWNVNEELNNEINRYISSYSGKNKEILDL